MRTRHPDLRRILAAVRAARPGPVLVLGGVDRGKTTLVRQMANLLAVRGPVWVVSADSGQAWIGPPTTLARARLARPRRRWTGLAAERMIFVGTTSPARCIGATAAALVRLASEGLPGAARVLVDTPGLVRGSLAAWLWERVAEELHAPLVVAVQKEDELAPILEPFAEAGAQVLTVRPHPLVRVRNRKMRTAYRATAYRRYFGRARLRFLPRDLPVLSALFDDSVDLDIGRLVALRDERGWDLALGIVRGIGAKRVTVLTPPARLAAVTSLVAGMLCLDPATGAEMSDP
jgi:polynucleotide 5'-kinase involved in rRNA processing